MTADERGLLAAVCESPDDDVPRLVYADWLDEHGRPDRAEFVRLQIRQRQLTGAAAGAATRRLKWLARLSEGWLVPGVPVQFPVPLTPDRRRRGLPVVAPTLGSVVTVFLWRGFIDQVEFEDRAVGMAAAPAVFAAHPVQVVGLDDRWMLTFLRNESTGQWAVLSSQPLPSPDAAGPGRRVNRLRHRRRADLVAALPAFLQGERDAIGG